MNDTTTTPATERDQRDGLGTALVEALKQLERWLDGEDADSEALRAYRQGEAALDAVLAGGSGSAADAATETLDWRDTHGEVVWSRRLDEEERSERLDRVRRWRRKQR